MSNYVENNLQKGETLIMKAKINFMAMFGQLLWAIICGVADIIFQIKKSDIINRITRGELTTSPSSLAEIQKAAEEQQALNITNNMLFYAQIAILVIGLLPLVIKIIRLAFTVLALTNKRVIGKTGIIAIKSLDIPIEKVETVVIETSFWGRIFKFYSIVIKSASGDHDGLRWKGIKNATEIKNAITAAIDKHAEEARQAQAAEIAMALGRK